MVGGDDMLLSIFIQDKLNLSYKSEILRASRLLDARITEVGLRDSFESLWNRIGGVNGDTVEDLIRDVNMKYNNHKHEMDRFADEFINRIKSNKSTKKSFTSSVYSIDVTKIELELMSLMKIKNIKDLNAFIYENTNIPVYRVIGMTSIGAVKAFVLRYLIEYRNKRSV